jgi:protein-L-isoaspartate(D-aspartate) O-methyltransferase
LKTIQEENRYAMLMVKRQLKSRGIFDKRVLEAMSHVPREHFMINKKENEAYGDHPEPIGYGQTISQPYMVAIMTEKLSLKGNEKVLEIGTGSGYQTAILAELAGKVYTIERIGGLFARAKKKLEELGYVNIHYKLGDGSTGWPEEAPFSGIIVTAAVPHIPDELKNQLDDNGILVIPVGDYRMFQTLTIVRREANHFKIRESIGCRFVPLIGEAGF